MNDMNTIYILDNVLPIILLVIGTFGHLCNLLIFSKRRQRTNPTSLYFLSSTITYLISLYVGMFTHYSQDTINIDVINTNPILCKLRSFILYLSLTLSNWFILLAMIDCYIIPIVLLEFQQSFLGFPIVIS